VILMYHGVTDLQGSRTNIFGKHVFVEHFREQIEFFVRNYNVVSLEDLIVALRSNRPIRDSLVITFDDGYRNMYSVAYPVLKEHGAPASVFLATGLVGTGRWAWVDKVEFLLMNAPLREIRLSSLNIDLTLGDLTQRREAIIRLKTMLKSCDEWKKGEAIQELEGKSLVECGQPMENYEFLNWDEIKEMSGNQISFGAHTVNHPILSRCYFEDAKEEILDSKRTIEKKLGTKITTFCYPNGKHGDYTPQIKEFCRKHFDCAVSANHGTVSIDGLDLYELRRIGVESDTRFPGLLWRLWRH